MRVKALPAIVVAVAALPCEALADSRISVARGTLTFFSEDVGIANRLVIEDGARGRTRLFEPVDPFGMRFSSAPCDPGRLNAQANIVEVFCDRRAFARIAVDIGDGEDSVLHSASLPAALLGGLGADRLRTAAAADAVNGGQGDDVLETGGGDDTARGEDGADRIATGAGADRVVPGVGADVVASGEGDDGIQSADGVADTIDCGAGYDTVLADTADRLEGCEGVTRQVVAPAGTPTPEDDTRPSLRVRAAGRQRLGARRAAVTVRATASERALVRASAFLAAGASRSALAIASAPATGAGDTARVVLRLSATQRRRALAALRRGRSARVRVTLTAVDPAGNTSRPRRVTVRLAR